MPGLSYTFAFFLGTFLECVMYGTFLPFFFAACYVQWEKSSKGRGINHFMVSATVFFGLAGTTSFVSSLFQAVQAISDNPPGVTIQLSGPPLPTWGIVQLTLLLLQTAVADVVIVYRMYHIYDRNPFVCVIPSITIAAFFVTGCGVANQLRAPATLPNLKALEGWFIACFCLAVFGSLFMTAAISFKLWRVHRETVRVGIHVEDSIILRVMRVLTESAALWTTVAMLNFFTALAKSNLTYVFLPMSSPALGISFCLIIVRLGRVHPEPRDETWPTYLRSPASRTLTSSRSAITSPQIQVQRDVYTSDSRDFSTGTLESQK